MNNSAAYDVRPAILNCETALGRALVAMFKSVETELTCENAPPAALTVVIFGGCAVHLYTSHRVSSDVDAEFFASELTSSLDLQAMLAAVPQTFVDEQSGRVVELSYDLNFTSGLGPCMRTIWNAECRLIHSGRCRH